MKLLLVNPNTSTFVTERMAAAARASLGAAAEVVGVTATEGPSIVADRAGNARAAQSTLALGLAQAEGFDAVIVGISTDAGLDALRPALRVPVVGMLEAALITACQRGERVGLMTLGPQMLPLYQERAAALGFGARMAGWAAPVLPAAYGPAPDDSVYEALADHAAALVAESRLDVLVLCGAVLAGSRPRIARHLRVPVVDALEAAAWQAVALARQA
ncbi:aspartate/glutamate racemase family protein [Ramlibacter sp. MAHUQ-53]|uniref:aspartate/glutamate racemase family protein n=1 Tax=unclassified Ramlibacter TaxID=2617605 RepID=UPI003642D877